MMVHIFLMCRPEEDGFHFDSGSSEGLFFMLSQGVSLPPSPLKFLQSGFVTISIVISAI